MHDSKENNHLFTKVFLLFLLVFVFSASADFNKRSNVETTTKTELYYTLKQQTDANLTSPPNLPVFKIKWSFGAENDFLFSPTHLIATSFAEQSSKIKHKLLLMRYLGLKQKFETQAFLTTLYKQSHIPLSHSA